MRRTFALIAMPLMMAGCGSDPASSRLEIGREVIVEVPNPDPDRPTAPMIQSGCIVTPMGTHPGMAMMWTAGGSEVEVRAGSRAVVLADDLPADVREATLDYLADLDGKVDRRSVKVRIVGGNAAGMVGELPRNTLRPPG